jgi:hypothetical protein
MLPPVRVTISWLCTVLLLLLTSGAFAQDADTDTNTETEAEARAQEARTLFGEGVVLAGEERFEEAAERFRRAYQLHPASTIAFNLGNALIESGRLVEGCEMLRQVTRDSESSGELRERAESIINEAEPRIGSIVVHVTGPLDDVEVHVGDSLLGPGSYGVPISADPGPIDATATRGMETVASTTVDVPVGGHAEVTLDVSPVETVAILPTEVAEEPTDDSGILGKWWFWTAVGALVVGVVLIAVVASTSGSNTEGSLGSGMLR